MKFFGKCGMCTTKTEGKMRKWWRENGQKEKASMTSELAAHPSASQSLRQHEYQSAAADRQDQMKKGEEEREQGLWGNDEAVKGNNCRCIFFFFFFFKAQGRLTQCKCERRCFWAASSIPEQSRAKAAGFVHRTLITIFLKPSWDRTGTAGGSAQSVRP